MYTVQVCFIILYHAKLYILEFQFAWHQMWRLLSEGKITHNPAVVRAVNNVSYKCRAFYLLSLVLQETMTLREWVIFLIFQALFSAKFVIPLHQYNWVNNLISQENFVLFPYWAFLHANTAGFCSYANNWLNRCYESFFSFVFFLSLNYRMIYRCSVNIKSEVK